MNIDSGAQDGRSETEYQAIVPDGMRDDGAQTRQWWVEMLAAFPDLSLRPSYPAGQ